MRGSPRTGLGSTAVAIVLMAAAVAGCATVPGSVPDPGSTATHPAQSGGATPQALALRDDLVAARPVQWDSWRLVDPTTVELTFLTGPASCEGVAATVAEGTDQVSIALRTGALPGSGACPAIALTSTTTVTLSRPLGDRQVRQP